MNEKRFKLVQDEWGPFPGSWSLATAVAALSGSDGRILDALSIGETWVDSDGDTWERVQ